MGSSELAFLGLGLAGFGWMVWTYLTNRVRRDLPLSEVVTRMNRQARSRRVGGLLFLLGILLSSGTRLLHGERAVNWLTVLWGGVVAAVLFRQAAWQDSQALALQEAPCKTSDPVE